MKLIRPTTVKELLNLIKYKGSIAGNSNTPIIGVNDDFFSADYDLTWATSASMLNTLLNRNIPLTVITHKKKNPKNDNIVIIYADNPLELFDRCISSLFIIEEKQPIIGANSVIHESAIICNNVIIGSNCSIGPNVVIYENTTIGDNVTISANSVIGATPFYSLRDDSMSFADRQVIGNVSIDDNIRIGASCVIDKGIVGTTHIGHDTRIGNLVEIGHDVRIGSFCSLAAQVAIAGYVEIGNYCRFWGRAGVINRIRIAANTNVCANSVVTKHTHEGDDLCGFPAIDRIKFWRVLTHLKC